MKISQRTWKLSLIAIAVLVVGLVLFPAVYVPLRNKGAVEESDLDLLQVSHSATYGGMRPCEGGSGKGKGKGGKGSSSNGSSKGKSGKGSSVRNIHSYALVLEHPSHENFIESLTQMLSILSSDYSQNGTSGSSKGKGGKGSSGSEGEGGSGGYAEVEESNQYAYNSGGRRELVSTGTNVATRSHQVVKLAQDVSSELLFLTHVFLYSIRLPLATAIAFEECNSTSTATSTKATMVDMLHHRRLIPPQQWQLKPLINMAVATEVAEVM